MEFIISLSFVLKQHNPIPRPKLKQYTPIPPFRHLYDLHCFMKLTKFWVGVFLCCFFLIIIIIIILYIEERDTTRRRGIRRNDDSLALSFLLSIYLCLSRPCSTHTGDQQQQQQQKCVFVCVYGPRRPSLVESVVRSGFRGCVWEVMGGGGPIGTCVGELVGLTN